jgi:hypothetical protein
MSGFGAFLPFADVRAIPLSRVNADVRRAAVKPTSAAQVR